MSDHLSDLEEVTALIEAYVRGANGDVELLRTVFHPMATMIGHIGPMETNVPIEGFFAEVEGFPGDPAGANYRYHIRSIDLTGDAGVAVVVERDYMGLDFVDYFSVARIDGRWQIVNKTYAHTGGFLPEDH
jgi:hypothetical protein